MAETSYQKVFEVIQSSLVPKSVYEELHNEICKLKTQIETEKNESKKWKSKYQDQKLTSDIIRAEKKTCEVKFEEVSLKLKQKTHQYGSLLKSNENKYDTNAIKKVYAGTQTIKEEPNEIGIVNVPASSASRSDQSAATINIKRSISGDGNLNTGRTKAKRRKITNSDRTIRTTRLSTQKNKKISCVMCLDHWGLSADLKLGDLYGGREDYDFCDADKKNVLPDPKKDSVFSIPTFSSFEEYRHHHFTDHLGILDIPEPNQLPIDDGWWLKKRGVCEEKSCLLHSNHSEWPHGEIKCLICSLSFKFKKDHDMHNQLQHAPIKMMSNKQIFDLYGLLEVTTIYQCFLSSIPKIAIQHNDNRNLQSWPVINHK